MFLFISDAYEAVNDLTTFFHWFDFINFWRLTFIVSKVDLLFLSSLFLAGFGKWQKSLKVTKQLLLPFTNTRSTTSWLCIIFVPSLLYVDMSAPVVRLLYSSFSIWYIFDFLSTKAKSFFDFFNVLMLSFNHCLR